MSPSSDVAVPSLRSVEDVIAVPRLLRTAPASQTVVLRLDHLESQTKVDPLAGSLLAATLCGRTRARELVVVVPHNESLLRQLARAGVWFALAQRSGVTTLRLSGDEGQLFDAPPAWIKLEAWRGHWQPSEHDFRARALGAPSDRVASPWEVIQHEFIAFKNPHLGVERSRLAREVNDNVVLRWLQRLVNSDDDENTWLPLLAAAGTTVRELLYNFAVHPFSTLTTASPLRRDVPKDRQIGYVALYTTKGGGAESFNRLHIVVADCGHGIPATLRPKLPRAINSETDSADQVLLKRMLEGSLPKYGRAEGRGFVRLVDLTVRHGGSLSVATAAQDGISGTLVANVTSRMEGPTFKLPPAATST